MIEFEGNKLSTFKPQPKPFSLALLANKRKIANCNKFASNFFIGRDISKLDINKAYRALPTKQALVDKPLLYSIWWKLYCFPEHTGSMNDIFHVLNMHKVRPSTVKLLEKRLMDLIEMGFVEEVEE